MSTTRSIKEVKTPPEMEAPIPELPEPVSSSSTPDIVTRLEQAKAAVHVDQEKIEQTIDYLRKLDKMGYSVATAINQLEKKKNELSKRVEQTTASIEKVIKDLEKFALDFELPEM